MVDDIMSEGTYGKEKELQTQIQQGGPIQSDAGQQQFVPPQLQQTDVFNQVSSRPSEPTIAGADQMGLVKMSGKEALRAAYSAYPSDSILQLYDSLDT